MKIKTIGIRLVIFSFMLIMVMACSMFKPKEKEEALKLLKIDNWSHDFHAHLKNICLQGEGRGIYSEKNDSYSFNYESLVDAAGKNWKTALYAPLQGEETFFVNYGTNPPRVEGTLVNKMKRDDLIDDFYNKLASYLEVMHDISFINPALLPSDLEQKCSLSKKTNKDSFSLSGTCKWSSRLKFDFEMNSKQLLLKFPLSHRYVLEIQNDLLHNDAYLNSSKDKKSYFEQTRLVLKKKRIIPPPKKEVAGPFLDAQSELFSLEFKIAECRMP